MLENVNLLRNFEHHLIVRIINLYFLSQISSKNDNSKTGDNN